jgi:hypothetical protein
MNDKELLARLFEDAGSPEEAAELLPVIQKLQELKTPNPTAQETAWLTESMRRFLIIRRNNTSLIVCIWGGWYYAANCVWCSMKYGQPRPS